MISTAGLSGFIYAADDASHVFNIGFPSRAANDGVSLYYAAFRCSLN